MRYKCIHVYKIALTDKLNTSQQCDQGMLYFKRNVISMIFFHATRAELAFKVDT